MNKQFNTKKQTRGIEWTDYTVNPIGGCFHRCEWVMPNGKVAECYAKTIVDRLAAVKYSKGFEHHYWSEHELAEPQKVKPKEPKVKFFVDSMSDLFGHWVPDHAIFRVLDMCEQSPWHIFQSLTKNPKRLLKIAEQRAFPKNLWIGASMPPDHMWGHVLTQDQQQRMLSTTLHILTALRVLHDHPVCWLSAEPLSWDVSGIIRNYDQALSWCVIGAASNGKKIFPPKREWVDNLLGVLDAQQVPVFFKGNLSLLYRGREHEWRELFPGFEPSPWNKYVMPFAQKGV